MQYAIGVDIGGTKTAIAVVRQDGKIVLDKKIQTDLSIVPEKMIGNIMNEIYELIAKLSLSENQFYGIGIGAPGPLESQKGIISNPPNLPAWMNLPIQKIMEEEMSLPVRLENDANVAALAEKWIGVAKNKESFIYMTISTGVGAGIIDNGILLRGRNGNAGDIGHMVIDPAMGPCGCGLSGCLESIVSGTAIQKRGSELIGSALTTEAIFDLYQQGNPLINDMIHHVLKTLGVACVNLINIFDPEMIIIGGGVSNAQAPILSVIKEYVSKYALNSSGRQTEIVRAGLDGDSGVIGAAALFLNELEKQAEGV